MPRSERVSKSYSAQTRWRSASVPFTWISTSQSIATPFGLGQQFVERAAVLRGDGRSQTVELLAEQSEGVEHGLAILQKDAGPQRRVAASHTGGVAEAAGCQLAQLRRQDPAQGRRRQ